MNNLPFYLIDVNDPYYMGYYFTWDSQGDLLQRDELLDWLQDRLGKQSPAETLRELKSVLRGEDVE